MAGLGTLVNVLAILAGATAGMLIKGGLPERFQSTITSAIGLCTVFIGIAGAMTGLLTMQAGGLKTQETMLMLVSLIGGAVIGEWLNIEARLEDVGKWCRMKLVKAGGQSEKMGNFVEAFVSSSLLFCVGAMAIVGALEDGLNHNYDILLAKSVMDGVMAVVFTASLGMGVYFSVFPIILYQGGITMLAGAIRPYLGDMVIDRMSFVGAILIFALGINLIFGKKIRIGNLLPAMFLPLGLQFFL